MMARRWIQRLLPVMISLGALVWISGSIEFQTLFDALSWRVVFIVTPVFLVYGALSLYLEAKSILWLLNPQPAGFSLWTAARIKCASYLLSIVNYTLGAAALSILLRRRAKIGLGEAASVVLLISSLDMIVVIGFTAVAAAFSESALPAMRGGLLALVGIGFFAGLALLRAPGSLGPIERIRTLAVFDALRTCEPRKIVGVGLLRIVFSLLLITLVGIAFVAFDLAPSLSQLVVGMMVVIVVSALPIAVAGLGTSQAAFLYMFRDLAEPGVLLAVSLVFTSAMILLRGGMGVVFAREFAHEVLEHRGDEAK